MTKLEHLNLVVSDIDTYLHFYRAVFPDWCIRGGGESTWYGKPRRWVHFGNDKHYLAISDHGEGENRDLTGHSLGLSHFAYVTDEINAIIERLATAGYQPHDNGAGHPYRKNVYYIDPAGFEVEFVEYLSDDVSERNQY